MYSQASTSLAAAQSSSQLYQTAVYDEEIYHVLFQYFRLCDRETENYLVICSTGDSPRSRSRPSTSSSVVTLHTVAHRFHKDRDNYDSA